MCVCVCGGGGGGGGGGRGEAFKVSMVGFQFQTELKFDPSPPQYSKTSNAYDFMLLRCQDP